MLFKKTGELWTVMIDGDYLPVPEINVFETKEEAEDYFRDAFNEELSHHEGMTTDDENHTAEECIEYVGYATFYSTKILLLTADTVKRA